MSRKDVPASDEPPGYVHLWSREGFNGDACITLRPHPVTDYVAVRGPHAPQRLDFAQLELPDRNEAGALPLVVATSRTGVTIAASARTAPAPFAWRNAEKDELHFVQEGTLTYVTDFGVLQAEPGDFVCLPRAVTYRVEPTSSTTLRVIVEVPERIRLRPPTPTGMINFGRDVHRPEPSRGSHSPGQTELLVKTDDGITAFTLTRDPLELIGVIDGEPPVWKINLAAIQPVTYLPQGGPPASFAETASKDVLLYTLSARPGGRPPMHYNADYDELIFYFRGPGPYGEISAPGTLAWTPKSIGHWGPDENVSEGYLAWLLESGGTIRLSQAGLDVAQPMETGQFGLHR